MAAPVGAATAAASPFRGVVTFGGLPLPGATITATQGTKTETAVSDADGAFQFDDLADGMWTIDIQMQTFAPVHAEVTIAPSVPAAAYELKLLSPDQIKASAQTAKPVAEPTPTPATAQTQQSQQTPQAQQANGKKPAQSNAPAAPQEIPKAPEENEQSADGFLVQGSVNNAATSQYATNPAFGNTRSGNKGLYTGGFKVTESNSALNAQNYALSGVTVPKPAFNDFTGAATLLGPIKIPHILPRGPNFFVSYQWTRNSNSVTIPGLVPTQAEQTGNLAGLTNAAGQPVTVYEPGTNTAYPGNQVPVSAQAAALLKLYPLPNITKTNEYNYQAAVLNNTHQDSLQSRFYHNLGRKDQFNGGFAFQSTRSDSVNMFGFVDQTGNLGMNGNVQWSHRLKPRVFLYTNFSFGRMRTEVTPNFENRVNVSGNAGITGNDQNGANWGPPTLGFGDGTAGLSDANSAFNRTRNDDVSVSTLVYRGKHNITAGGEFRKQEYNDFVQQNPRGTFTFTGAATQGACTNPADMRVRACGFSYRHSRHQRHRVRQCGQVFSRAGVQRLFQRRLARAADPDHQCGRALGLQRADDGVVWPAGESRCRQRFHGSGAGAGQRSGGAQTGGALSGFADRPGPAHVQPRIGITWRPIPASTVVIKAGTASIPTPRCIRASSSVWRSRLRFQRA